MSHSNASYHVQDYERLTKRWADYKLGIWHLHPDFIWSYRLLLSATYLLMYINLLSTLPGEKHAVLPGIWMLIMGHIVLPYTPSFTSTFSSTTFSMSLNRHQKNCCWFFLSSILLFVVDKTILFSNQASVNINLKWEWLRKIKLASHYKRRTWKKSPIHPTRYGQSGRPKWIF